MTCEDCQAIVIELARDGADRDAVVHAAERDEARRHAALCSRCGEALQEQLWLTEQVRALAAEESTQQTPERVEIAVLAAWRAHHGVASAGMPSTSVASAGASSANGNRHATAAGAVIPFEQARAAAGHAASTSTRTAAPRWLAPAVVVAALASAAIALLFVWPPSHSAPAGAPAGQIREVATAAPNVTTATPTAQDSHNAEVASAPAATNAAAVEATSEEPQEASPLESSAAARAGSAVHAETMMARTDNTEFQPLPYVEPLRSTEARHIVRVSLTSGDEMMAGVMPIDRRIGETTLEADVLVGEDGIARAIRIVR